MTVITAVYMATGTFILGVVGGYIVRVIIGKSRFGSIEKEMRAMLEKARLEAAGIVKDAQIHAKNEVIKARDELEQSMKSKRNELAQIEERIRQKENNLEKKVAMVEKKEKLLEEKSAAIEAETVVVKQKIAELDKIIQEEKINLQKIARMTPEEAKQLLLDKLEKELQNEMSAVIRRRQEEVKEISEREAKRIIAMAVQRYAASHAGEITTSTVTLPGDEVKGRIIGRDGRNIRALEAATGVNILIDDTPETVVISGFDPVRREIAKMAIETLVADGRIHPGRIEEVVSRAQDELSEIMRKAGEEAIYSVGIQNAAPELVNMIGRLKFRSSYSQNVLQHSIEVANLMGIMAGELGLDVQLAKRIGLLHDIGKAMDHEVEGGHASIGADFLKKHGEQQVVVNAIAAHHEEITAESIYAVLASAADAISSSRVGARSESTAMYLKRLEKLESIANSCEGVKKSYAIQAGREIRVIVEPEKVDDGKMVLLARDISKKVENELQYPGQIKVVVIRETRCVEYAR